LSGSACCYVAVTCGPTGDSMRIGTERKIAFSLGLGTAAVSGSDDYLTLTSHGRRIFSTYVPKRLQPAAKLGLRGANVIGGVGKLAIAYDQYKGLQNPSHPLNRMADRSSQAWLDSYTHGFSLGLRRSPEEGGYVVRNQSLPPTSTYISGGVVYLP